MVDENNNKDLNNKHQAALDYHQFPTPLMGMSRSAHIVAQAITVRNLVNYECCSC